MTFKLICVAALGMAGAFWSSDVEAFIRKAPGYVEINAFDSCSGSETTFCRLDFDRLPKNLAMFVTRIGCYVTQAGATRNMFFGSTQSPGGGNPINSFNLTTPTTTIKDGVRYSSFNQELFLRIDGDTVPSLVIYTLDPGPISMSCRIVGTPAKD